MDSDNKNNFQDLRISDFTFQYRFPYPISAAYHQMKVAIEPIKKVILVQDTFAAFLQYLAVLSICEYLSMEHQSPKIDDMLQEMNRPSLGQWLGIFREVQDWFVSREHRQVMEELGDLWAQSRFRAEFLRDANLLINLRNEFSHGKTPPNETLADRLLQDEKQCLYKLLNPFIFLNKYPFGYVDGLKYQEWKFQGFFHKAMGSDSSFPTLPITFEKPIEEQTLFLMSKDLGRIIQLKPFYVFATCPKCDLDHVFAFNQIQNEKLKYISVLHRHELVEEKDPASRMGKGCARLHELLGRKVEVKPMCSVSIPEKMKRSIVLPQLTVKEGNVLAGKYKVLGLINQGGMGDVFMGHHVSLDQTVAIKIMRQDLARENRYVTRFHREARMLSKMMHPNIVKVLDNGIDEECNFIIEEFVPNGDLSDRLARDGAMTEDQAIEIIRDAARGLAHAHAKGLIHRDIKPSNILFREDGAAVLTDFGIAKDTSSLTMLTATADIMGTSQYMSPEQREGAKKDITPASDIYSLGVVLFEMLGGCPGLEKVRIDSLKGVSKPTLELIGKMLAPIGQRPNDGTELLKLIESPAGQIIPAPSQVSKRKPILLFASLIGAAGIMMIIVALGINLGWFWNNRKPDDTREEGAKREAIAQSPEPVSATNPTPTPVPPAPEDMVFIPAGDAWMGCVPGDNDCKDDEKPRVKVYVDGFYMDLYEVTNKKYRECVKSGKCKSQYEGLCWQLTSSGPAEKPVNELKSAFRGGDNPVVCVDWDMAKSYCAWAGKRLPSEAEWEKAARGGSGSRYYWGGNVNGEYAWYVENSGNRAPQSANSHEYDQKDFLSNKWGGKTHPVGKKTPNGYGLYDIIGNVLEWVEDCYDGGWYRKLSNGQRNPSNINTANCMYRVMRGGKWTSSEKYLRISYREKYYSEYRDYTIGFRCARNP